MLKLLRQISRFFNFLPCPLCGRGDGNGVNELCPECRAKLRFIDPARRCPGCGGEKDGALALCSKCLAEKRRAYLDAAAVMHYHGAGRKLILAFKSGTPELARTLGKMGAQVYRDAGFAAEVVVPIPLHPYRYWRRTYNQAELFARYVGKELDLPVALALKRRHAGGKQAKLNRSGRLRNARHRFEVGNAAAIAGRNVLLVDDVLTTGATVDAATRVLLRAGARSVVVLCAARTPKAGELDQ